MARRKYSDEYQQEAVSLTELPGATITGVAKDLDINGHMLGKWRKAMQQHGEKAFPGSGHAHDQEVMQLKRENARPRKERVFLKEAAAFFAKEQK